MKKDETKFNCNESVVVMSAVRYALTEYPKFYDIKGYEGLYQVNKLGEIKSVERFQKNKNKIIQEFLLRKTKDNNGYERVFLSKNGKTKTYYVHRIVADNFITKIAGKEEINHIDRDRENNNVENLEWVSHKENIIHSARCGAYSEKRKNNTSGYCGITFDKKDRKWKVRVTKTGARKFIGVFDTKDEAIKCLFGDKKNRENIIIEYATNYMLGRSSYGVGCVCDYIKENINRLTNSNKQVITRDIKECVEQNPELKYKKEWLEIVELLN
jgi:hypothetical protein